MTKMEEDDILKKAYDVVHGDRTRQYGPPEENIAHVAEIATSILNKKISPRDVVVILIALKLSREIVNPKEDNLLDILGYTWVWHQVKTKPARL